MHRTATIFILFIFYCSGLLAQQTSDNIDTLHDGATDMYVGKVFDSTEMARIRQSLEKSNQLHIGQHYLPFQATTTTGQHISNETCRGKVTLVLLWMVTGGDNSLAEFN